MQREIEDLRAGSTGSSASDGTTSSDSGTATDGGSSASTQAAPTDQAGFEAAIADLESRASDAVATADAVAVPSAPADRPQAYFDATRPLEALDDEIDRLDDQIEDAHRAKTIDRNTMWSLEDRLDGRRRSDRSGQGFARTPHGHRRLTRHRRSRHGMIIPGS